MAAHVVDVGLYTPKSHECIIVKLLNVPFEAVALVSLSEQRESLMIARIVC